MPATYNPGSLAVAYSPSPTAWPTALWITLAVMQQAHGHQPAGRSSYLGAAYRPQTGVSEESMVSPTGELPFEETRLAALPVRSYRVKAKIRSWKKGQLHL